MAEILLISDNFLKREMIVSNNVDSKYVLSSIREAQDLKLKHIIGTRLLEKLKDLIDKDEVKSHPDYAELLRECRYVLAYASIVQLYDNVSFKISNYGVNKTTDDHIESISNEDFIREKTLMQSKCDAYTYDLQNYLLENRSKFPELDENTCRQIKSNLHHTASCGIFLGGRRGRTIRR